MSLLMSRATIALLVVTAAALPLAGCGEKAQTAGRASAAKPDSKAWDGAQNGAYTASGWKAGDQASWDEQMRTRAQNQNEYSRAPAQ